MKMSFLILILSCLIHSTISETDLNTGKISNNSNPTTKAHSPCQEQDFYVDILSKLIGILLQSMHNDSPKIDTLNDVHEMISKQFEKTPTTVKNFALLDKIKTLQDQLVIEKKDEYSGRRMPHGKTRDSRAKVVFKYDLPSINISECKEVFMGFVNVAHNSYLEAAQYPLCLKPESAVLSTTTQDYHDVQNIQTYHFEGESPHSIYQLEFQSGIQPGVKYNTIRKREEPRDVISMLQNYRPGDVVELPGNHNNISDILRTQNSSQIRPVVTMRAYTDIPNHNVGFNLNNAEDIESQKLAQSLRSRPNTEQSYSYNAQVQPNLYGSVGSDYPGSNEYGYSNEYSYQVNNQNEPISQVDSYKNALRQQIIKLREAERKRIEIEHHKKIVLGDSFEQFEPDSSLWQQYNNPVTNSRYPLDFPNIPAQLENAHDNFALPSYNQNFGHNKPESNDQYWYQNEQLNNMPLQVQNSQGNQNPLWLINDNPAAPTASASSFSQSSKKNTIHHFAETYQKVHSVVVPTDSSSEQQKLTMEQNRDNQLIQMLKSLSIENSRNHEQTSIPRNQPIQYPNQYQSSTTNINQLQQLLNQLETVNNDNRNVNIRQNPYPNNYKKSTLENGYYNQNLYQNHLSDDSNTYTRLNLSPQNRVDDYPNNPSYNTLSEMEKMRFLQELYKQQELSAKLSSRPPPYNLPSIPVTLPSPVPKRGSIFSFKNVSSTYSESNHQAFDGQQPPPPFTTPQSPIYMPENYVKHQTQQQKATIFDYLKLLHNEETKPSGKLYSGQESNGQLQDLLDFLYSSNTASNIPVQQDYSPVFDLPNPELLLTSPSPPTNPSFPLQNLLKPPQNNLLPFGMLYQNRFQMLQGFTTPCAHQFQSIIVPSYTIFPARHNCGNNQNLFGIIPQNVPYSNVFSSNYRNFLPYFQKVYCPMLMSNQIPNYSVPLLNILYPGQNPLLNLHKRYCQSLLSNLQPGLPNPQQSVPYLPLTFPKDDDQDLPRIDERFKQQPQPMNSIIKNQENELPFNQQPVNPFKEAYQNNDIPNQNNVGFGLPIKNPWNSQQPLNDEPAAVTNLMKLNSMPTKPDVIELTYLLKGSKTLPNQEPFHVKYRIPFDVFVSNFRELLLRRPRLRKNPDDLYKKLSRTCNLTEVSPGLEKLDKDNIIKLLSHLGSYEDAEPIRDYTRSSYSLLRNNAETVYALELKQTIDALDKAINLNSDLYAPESPITSEKTADLQSYNTGEYRILPGKLKAYSQLERYGSTINPLNVEPEVHNSNAHLVGSKLRQTNFNLDKPNAYASQQSPHVNYKYEVHTYDSNPNSDQTRLDNEQNLLRLKLRDENSYNSNQYSQNLRSTNYNNLLNSKKNYAPESSNNELNVLRFGPQLGQEKNTRLETKQDGPSKPISLTSLPIEDSNYNNYNYPLDINPDSPSKPWDDQSLLRYNSKLKQDYNPYDASLRSAFESLSIQLNQNPLINDGYNDRNSSPWNNPEDQQSLLQINSRHEHENTDPIYEKLEPSNEYQIQHLKYPVLRSEDEPNDQVNVSPNLNIQPNESQLDSVLRSGNNPIEKPDSVQKLLQNEPGPYQIDRTSRSSSESIIPEKTTEKESVPLIDKPISSNATRRSNVDNVPVTSKHIANESLSSTTHIPVTVLNVANVTEVGTPHNVTAPAS